MSDAAEEMPHAPQMHGSPIRGSTVLLGGRLISIAANLLIQVIVVRYLTKQDYGSFVYAVSIVTLGQAMVTLGLDRSGSRFISIYRESDAYGKVLGTLIVEGAVVLVLGTLFVIAVLMASVTFGTQLIDDPAALKLLLILAILAPIQALDNLLMGLFSLFAGARSIFFRKYVLAPALRVAVVAVLIIAGLDVSFLAVGYVIAGGIGVAIYAGVLVRLLGRTGVLEKMRAGIPQLPIREILVFTLPLFTTDLVFLAMNGSDVLILGAFRGTAEVAAYRVVQPIALLNQVVMTSFTLLFIPAASTLFARRNHQGSTDLYWQTAIWIAVISFPIFAVTSALAAPLIETLYGQRYADSALFLALLSTGYYFNAALGFNGLTLQLHGKLSYVFWISIATAAFNVGLNLVLIPRFGALGAAVGTTTTLIVHNVLKQVSLRAATGIAAFDRTTLKVYAIIVSTALVLAVASWLNPGGVVVDASLTIVASVVVLWLNRERLRLGTTFPEARRLPLLGRLFSQ